MSRLMATSRVASEINVTPLCDIMLVLLIIFMIVAPILHGDVPAALPRAIHPRAIPHVDGMLKLTLRADGRVFLDGSVVPESDVPSRLTAALGRTLVLRADENLDYERVQRFMDMLRRAGFSDVALATQDLESGLDHARNHGR